MKRTLLIMLLVPPPVVPPPDVRVPALAFGELFGKSWSQRILNVDGPLAKPFTRNI